MESAGKQHTVSLNNTPTIFDLYGPQIIHIYTGLFGCSLSEGKSATLCPCAFAWISLHGMDIDRSFVAAELAAGSQNVWRKQESIVSPLVSNLHVLQK